MHPAVLPRGLLILSLLLGVATAGQTQGVASDRERFLRASNALASGDLEAYKRLEPTLRDYPLHPYLRFSELLRDLDATRRTDINAFLDDQGQSPLGRRLRSRWLRYLARTGQWRYFAEDYEAGLGTELECYRLEAQYRTGEREQALGGVPKLWISASSRPDACDPIFQLWIDAGGPTRDQAWERIRLAATAGQLGLAKYLKRFIPQAERAIADLWIEAYRQPAEVLEEGRLDPRSTQALPIAVNALHRLARVSPQSAAANLEENARRFRIPDETIAALRYRIAIGLAVDGHPAAAFWLDAVPEANRDASLRAWSVRTALRKRDWGSVLEQIEGMPEEERKTVRWRFWRARALEALGDPAAKEQYGAVALERDYHGFLAADRIGTDPVIVDRPLEVNATVRHQVVARLPIQRAGELYAINRVREASAEWQYGLLEADADTYRAAASIAHEWGWYSQAIVTVARARDWNDLEMRFPTRYREMVLAAARENQIDPAWIYGILRQESLFNPTIRSRAGATGLMQIMPATGRQVAKDLGMSWAGRSTLVRPESNIKIGSRYLRMGLDRLDGRHIFATAGYNAGPGRVEQWRSSGESVPADIWIELVPFRETRRYLRKVIEYTVIYQHRLGQQTDFVSRVMGPVIGKRKRTASASTGRDA